MIKLLGRARYAVRPDMEKVSIGENYSEEEWNRFLLANSALLVPYAQAVAQVSGLDIPARQSLAKQLELDEGWVVPAKEPELIQERRIADQILAEVCLLDQGYLFLARAIVHLQPQIALLRGKEEQQLFP